TGPAHIESLNTINYNDLEARAGTQTPYDQLANDANIGPSPNFDFVSGTGAHDIISITKSGANASVSVTAYADAAHTTPIPVPGVGGNTYTYSFPLSKPILVFAGDSDDIINVDGNLGENVTIDGMLGTDSLHVNGMGAATATYTPNTTAPL